MLLKQSPIVANSKIKLPVGCIIHVLWFKGEQLAYFQLDNGYTYSMRWADLFKADYLGEGLHIKRPVLGTTTTLPESCRGAPSH